MNGISRYVVTVLCALCLSSSWANDAELSPQRDYRFIMAPSYEMDLVSVNSESLNRVFQDTYTKGIGPRIGNDTVRYWLGEAWAVFWTYMYVIWPHELGHWVRGKQGTGEFIFHNYALPFPHTTVNMRENATLEDRIVISIGGFEINSLMAQQAQMRFYENKYLYVDTTVNSFIHRVFFPLYSFVIFPADAEKPDTWINTAGDPVHFVLPTYERYTGRSAITGDGSVDKELINFYREATWMSLLWNMLDPFFYQAASALGNDTKDKPFGARPRLLGDYNLGWTYGTLFNPSPLGYELYLNNYLYWQDKLYVFWMKYGRPYKNNALGMKVPNLYQYEKLTLSAAVEAWDQDIYGQGGAVASTLRYDYSKRLSFFVKAEWKDRGYQLGKRLQQRANAFLGFSYH